MDPSNPYEAPSASLQNATSDDDSGFLAEPREVPAGAAVEWFGAAWNLVTADMGMWILVFVLLMVGLVVLSCVPFGTNLLMPVLTAGIALGCDAQRRGEPLSVECLFAGFKSPHVMQLVFLGLLTMLVTLGAMLVVMPVMFGGMALLGGLQEGGGDPVTALLFPVLVFIVILAVVVPLTMATIFSPMLVVFRGMPAWDAMLLSLRACLRNIGALIVWMLLGMLVAVLATLPLLLGWFVAFPLFMATNYVAYRDLFYER